MFGAAEECHVNVGCVPGLHDDAGVAAMVDSAGHILKGIDNILDGGQAEPQNGEAIVANGLLGAPFMVTPVIWQGHHAPTNDERELAAGQVRGGVKLLTQRPTADAELGCVEDTVSAEAVALALHAAALPLGDAWAVGARPVLALADRLCELQSRVAPGVQQLLVAFQTRVHGH